MDSENDSICLLIAKKEQEIAKLREDSLKQLEEKLRHREEALRALEVQLAALRTDFQYNLDLLDGRDAELSNYGAALQKAEEEAKQKDALMAAMRQAICEAEAALLLEHEARVHAESALQQQRRALMQELADVKSASTLELERAQQAAAAKRSSLEEQMEAQQQRAALELGQLQKQHAEIAAEMKAQHATLVAKLELRIAALQQLGQQREDDLKAAQQDVKVQTAHAAAVTARLQDLQKEAKALASKAETMQQTHKAELQKQQLEVDALMHQLQQQQQAHEARICELQKLIEALQRTVAEQKADNAAESSTALAAHEAHVQMLETRLADATAQTAWLTRNLEEAKAALEMQQGVLQEQLQRILADKEGQIQALHDAFGTQQREFEAELEQLHTAAAADQHDLQSMAEQLAALEAYGQQQEQELADCRAVCERYEAAAHVSPSQVEWESMLRRVTTQRDEAQSTALDCQAKKALQEMEVQQLKQQLRASLHHNDAAGKSDVVEWAIYSEESSPSASEAMLRSHHSAVQGALPATGHPGQRLEVLTQARALEAAQAQNAQLQAALHALASEMQQLQQAQSTLPLPKQPATHQPLQDATNTVHEQGKAELCRLRKEVGRLKSEVQRLSAENGRLMEMSNALRAERNKLGASSGQPSAAYSAWPSQGSAVHPQQVMNLLPQFNPKLAVMMQQPCLPPLVSSSSATPAALPAESKDIPQLEESPLPSAADGGGISRLQGLGVVGQHIAGGGNAAISPPKLPRSAAGAASSMQKAKSQQQQCLAKPKVRNYNIKDDQ